MLQEFLVTEDMEHTTEDTERVGMVIGREESVGILYLQTLVGREAVGQGEGIALARCGAA